MLIALLLLFLFMYLPVTAGLMVTVKEFFEVMPRFLVILTILWPISMWAVVFHVFVNRFIGDI